MLPQILHGNEPAGALFILRTRCASARNPAALKLKLNQRRHWPLLAGGDQDACDSLQVEVPGPQASIPSANSRLARDCLAPTFLERSRSRFPEKVFRAVDDAEVFCTPALYGWLGDAASALDEVQWLGDYAFSARHLRSPSLRPIRSRPRSASLSLMRKKAQVRCQSGFTGTRWCRWATAANFC